MEIEEMEKIAKQKANHKCVICHAEVQNCYELDKEMIPLCCFCARKYLGNPDIAKQLKQIRDYWYEQVQKAIQETGNTDILLGNIEEEPNRLDRNTVAIYHVVYETEGLEESAKSIYELLYSSQEKQPDYKRILYLDIDGHTDEYGRFDEEMIELQQDFIIGTLLPYFYEIHMPILDVKNTELQKNDVPKDMVFVKNDKDLMEYLSKQMPSGGYLIEKLEKKYYHENRKIVYKKNYNES